MSDGNNSFHPWPGTLETHKTQLPEGWLLHIHHPKKISPYDHFLHPDQNLIAFFNIDRPDISYDRVYLQFSPEGEIVGKFKEEGGYLPSPFEGPEQSVWVRMTSNDSPNREVILPWGDRTGWKEPKTIRSLGWDHLGFANGHAVFHYADSFSAKAEDKIMSVTWDKKGAPKAGKFLKIPMPKGNEMLYSPTGELHGIKFDYENQHICQRQFALDGTVLQERTLQADPMGMLPAKLSFEEESWVYMWDPNSIYYTSISPDGKIEKQLLYRNEETDHFFYNIWKPVPLGKDRFAIQFTHGKGNGWMIAEKGTVVELMMKGMDPAMDGKGYKDVLNGRVLSIEHEFIILHTLVGDGNGGYYAAFSVNKDAQISGTEYYLYRCS